MLAVELPRPVPQTPTGGWCWHTQPPDVCDAGLVWAIDGSRKIDGTAATLTTGCGVAVIDGAGSLVAYAHATLPPWVRTAVAAEAWGGLAGFGGLPPRRGCSPIAWPS